MSTLTAASALLVALFAMVIHYGSALKGSEVIPEAVAVEGFSWLGCILSVGLLVGCAAAWDLTRRLSRSET